MEEQIDGIEEVVETPAEPVIPEVEVGEEVVEVV